MFKEPLNQKILIPIVMLAYLVMFNLGVLEKLNSDGVLTPIGHGLWYTQLATLVMLIVLLIVIFFEMIDE